MANNMSHNSSHSIPISTQPPRTPKNIFFLDWDNTLFCTDYLTKQHFKEFVNFDEDLEEQLSKCEAEIETFLQNLLELGDVYIVTNATLEWIKSCMNTCYPRLWKARSDILTGKLISARDEFESSNPSDPTLWKSLTFSKILKSTKGFQSVFSIGDSQSERQALFSVVKMHYPLCYAKSIKFLSSSSVVQILRQLRLISMNISVLIERKNDLDLMMKETSEKKY